MRSAAMQRRGHMNGDHGALDSGGSRSAPTRHQCNHSGIVVPGLALASAVSVAHALEAWAACKLLAMKSCKHLAMKHAMPACGLQMHHRTRQHKAQPGQQSTIARRAAQASGAAPVPPPCCLCSMAISCVEGVAWRLRGHSCCCGAEALPQRQEATRVRDGLLAAGHLSGMAPGKTCHHAQSWLQSLQCCHPAESRR